MASATILKMASATILKLASATILKLASATILKLASPTILKLASEVIAVVIDISLEATAKDVVFLIISAAVGSIMVLSVHAIAVVIAGTSATSVLLLTVVRILTDIIVLLALGIGPIITTVVFSKS